MRSDYFDCTIDEAIQRLKSKYEIKDMNITKNSEYVAVYIQTFDVLNSNIDIVINNLQGKNKITVTRIIGTTGIYGVQVAPEYELEQNVIDCIKYSNRVISK